ncbi:hypothetical protein B0H34DRAFT_861816 [Crassisporium funariophilum]|nr:hypothetical protein B0H34DRAFT_861816 [Crassisporium funariophilum]
MLEDLQRWQVKIWEDDWKEKWPSYGAEDLVSDADLQEIVRHARTLKTVNNIDAITHIPHLNDLGDALLQAISKILLEVLGVCMDEDILDITADLERILDPGSAFENLEWMEPQNPATMEDVNDAEEERKAVGQLAPDCKTVSKQVELGNSLGNPRVPKA